MTGWEATSELQDLALHSIHDPKLLAIVMKFLEDKDFPEAYGGATRHHAYPGGLAVHTLEVASQVALWEPGDQNLIAAAIMHDFGKIYAYKASEKYVDDGRGRMVPGVEKTPFERMVRHLVYSWHKFMRHAEEMRLDDDRIWAISHIMLAHHGRREWGSPIEPATKGAYLIHAADMLSMQAEGGEEKKR